MTNYDANLPSPKPDDANHVVIPRRPLWKYTLAAAGVTAVLSWLALWGSSDDVHVLEPAAPIADEPIANAAPARATPAATPDRRVRAAEPAAVPTAAGASDPQADARDLQALRSENAGDRIEALRAIRDRGAVALLPQLLSRDPAQDPDAAPTLITVSSELAQRADEAQRTAAAAKLGSWLDAETQRAEHDARANVSVLVEALGTLESPESVRALVAALDSDHLPVHVATLAARGLSKLNDPSARDAVQRFRERVAAPPQAADGFERELYAEARAAADSALSKWNL